MIECCFVIKYLYTNVKAEVLYAEALFREIDILQEKEEFLLPGLCTKFI